MDTTVKVTSMHIVAGLVAALISTALTVGWFGFKNDIKGFLKKRTAPHPSISASAFSEPDS